MNITPIKAIRRKCLDCSGGSTKMVRDCNIPSCELFPYRMGKRPDKETLEKHFEALR